MSKSLTLGFGQKPLNLEKLLYTLGFKQTDFVPSDKYLSNTNIKVFHSSDGEIKFLYVDGVSDPEYWLGIHPEVVEVAHIITYGGRPKDASKKQFALARFLKDYFNARLCND